jgi:hypothetical protein
MGGAKGMEGGVVEELVLFPSLAKSMVLVWVKLRVLPPGMGCPGLGISMLMMRKVTMSMTP